jgi:hypothetical protein
MGGTCSMGGLVLLMVQGLLVPDLLLDRYYLSYWLRSQNWNSWSSYWFCFGFFANHSFSCESFLPQLIANCYFSRGEPLVLQVQESLFCFFRFGQSIISFIPRCNQLIPLVRLVCNTSSARSVVVTVLEELVVYDMVLGAYMPHA